MTHHAQAAFFHLGGILHAQSAGRSVAGIGKPRLAVRRALLIDLFEIFGAHIDLAADFNKFRDWVLISARKFVRDIRNNPRIGGNLLAHGAIATGSGRVQTPVAVDQVDGEAIDLQLRQVGFGGRPIQPVLHLTGAKDVIEAHHALEVLNILAGVRGCTYLLGRRIRNRQLRVLLF